MELFLTSSVQAVAHDIAKKVDLAKGNDLVFIDTASEPKGEREDLEWQRADRQSLVDAGFAVTDYSITGKSKDELKTELIGYDFIYLSGGNTSYLLQQSQKSGFIELINDLVIKEGKVYIGTSAGSIIAGRRLPDYFPDEYELVDKDCFALVNFTLLPHWGDDHFKDKYLGERLKIAYRDDQVPLILLTDNQYVHFKDGGMQIIEIEK